MAQAQRRRMTEEEHAAPATVCVACKIPQGLIMRVFDMVETPTPVMGGGTRMEKIAQPRPQSVRIHGNSHPQNKAPDCQMVGGFALTYGVDQQFWERWVHDNRESDMVRNGLIYAYAQPQSTVERSEDDAEKRSGLERLDPKKLPSGIKTDTDSMDKKTIGRMMG